jgi:hypothetical protein
MRTDFFILESSPVRISEADFGEIKSRGALDQIPVVKTSRYKINESTESSFSSYTKGLSAKEIIFIKSLSNFPSEDDAFKIMRKWGQNIKIIPKEKFPKKNSANFIGIVF